MRLGLWGEEVALKHLEAKGMVLLARNFRVAAGEIDLIMRDDDMLVFIEVKTRRSLAYGSPEESVTGKKLGRIYKAALEFLERNDCGPSAWRIDLIAIECSRERSITRIDHYPNLAYDPS
jgi:putative endonuclease